VITRAYVGERAKVRSLGNVVIAADDATEIDLRAGLSASSAASAAGSVTAGVVEKTVEAFIADGADVVALGTKGGISTNSGDFAITNVTQPGGTGEVNAPFNPLANNVTSLLSSEVLNKIEGLLADAFTAATSDSAPPLDPSLAFQRRAT